MYRYIHERPEWPNFTWDNGALIAPLGSVRLQQGLLLGRMRSLGFLLQEEASILALTEDVVKTSEIEGVQLNVDQVRSSIALRLGVDVGGVPADRRVDGVVRMMLDATRNYDRPLDAARLCRWQAGLFEGTRERVTRGRWRPGGISVVSDAVLGRTKVHFEGPPADAVPTEVAVFLEWFNGPDATDGILRSAVGHLWFVTIHPFDDGNGRVSRAVADMLLSRSEHDGRRFYSMSAQIRRERYAYYDILERTQKGSLDVTPWLAWYLGCLERAILGVGDSVRTVLRKARFWSAHADLPFNARQRLMLNTLLDGFEGKLTSSKWEAIAKCSQDTALRDIQALLDLGVLAKDSAGGRSTSYSLRFE